MDNEEAKPSDLDHAQSLERQIAEAEANRAIRQLAANLLRIIRGAGASHEVRAQARAVHDTFERHLKVFGQVPDVSQVLSIDSTWNPGWMKGLPGHELERLHGQEMIIRGALQQAASRLLDQKTQETAGRQEMYDGIRAVKEAQEEGKRARNAPSAPPAREVESVSLRRSGSSCAGRAASRRQ